MQWGTTLTPSPASVLHWSHSEVRLEVHRTCSQSAYLGELSNPNH